MALSAKSATLLGRGIEVAMSLAAVALSVVACRRFGVGRNELAWFLVAASPLVGEFAATMAYRYESGMSLRDAGARFLRPSRCDACGIALTQWDILPVVPYAVRRGRCSCRKFAVPATCTLAGIATTCTSAAILAGALATGTDALAPLALFVSFVPAVVADLAHGEVDEWLLVLPTAAALFLLPDPLWLGPAMAALLAVNLWSMGLFARLAAGRGAFGVGVVDVAAAAVTGLYLTFQDAVSASVWFLGLAALSHALVRIPAARRLMPAGGAAYGPGLEEGEDDHGAVAAPTVPAIAFAAVLGMLWHVA